MPEKQRRAAGQPRRMCVASSPVLSCGVMNRESYPAAQQVAPKVHAHFQTHMAAARERGVVPGAILPPPEVIERIINAAFWASLRREEGYVPKISIAYLPQEQDPKRLSFERSLPLTPPALAKVAPVVERAGIHLGVWHEGADGELRVWGTTQSIPTFCF